MTPTEGQTTTADGVANPCKRHKWQWVRNVEIWRIGPRTGSMKLRGLYRCECGQKKHGNIHITPITITGAQP